MIKTDLQMLFFALTVQSLIWLWLLAGTGWMVDPWEPLDVSVPEVTRSTEVPHQC